MARVKAGPDCDVWAGISPRKPIETIELTRYTAGGADLVARIEPNGKGFVAVVPPYVGINHPIFKHDYPTLETFRTYSKVYDVSQPSKSAYLKVFNLVAPIRDFQGGFGLEAESDYTREVFETKDRRTRKIVCRQELSVMPVRQGPAIVFRFSNRKQPAITMTGTNCDDNAQRNADLRNQQAIQHIIEATGEAAAIRAASDSRWPYCGNTEIGSKKPCILPIE